MISTFKLNRNRQFRYLNVSFSRSWVLVFSYRVRRFLRDCTWRKNPTASHSFSTLALRSSRDAVGFFQSTPTHPVVQDFKLGHSHLRPILSSVRRIASVGAHTPICQWREPPQATSTASSRLHLLRPGCRRDRESTIPADRRSKGQTKVTSVRRTRHYSIKFVKFHLKEF